MEDIQIKDIVIHVDSKKWKEIKKERNSENLKYAIKMLLLIAFVAPLIYGVCLATWTGTSMEYGIVSCKKKDDTETSANDDTDIDDNIACFDERFVSLLFLDAGRTPGGVSLVMHILAVILFLMVITSVPLIGIYDLSR